MNDWIIVAIIVFVVLLIPVVFSFNAELDLLKGEGVVKAKIYGISVINAGLKLEYSGIVKLTNSKGKQSELNLIATSKFANYLNTVILILIKNMGLLKFDVKFIFGSADDAAKVGTICGSYIALVNAICAIKYKDLDILQFGFEPVYTDNVIRFKLATVGFWAIIQILNAFALALLHLIIKNKKAVKLNESK